MLASVAIIVFIFSWNEFLLAFILTARDAQTVPVAVAGLAGTMSFDWPLDRRGLGLLDDPGLPLRRLRPAPHRDRARLGCGEMRSAAA